jgi:hypothetical protein
MARAHKDRRKTIELYFINPNILFLDQEKSTGIQKSGKLGVCQSAPPPKSTRARTATSARSGRLEEASKANGIQANDRENQHIQDRLNSYIKMERALLKFRATGQFKGHQGY